jgi:hypothetical protein
MVLKINNLYHCHSFASLPLKATPTGPLLLIEDEFFEPIEWIVNSAVIGQMPELAASLARGEEVFIKELYAIHPVADEDLSEAKARWCKLIAEEGNDALPAQALDGEELYILGTSFTDHEVVLPRKTLLQIIEALEELRAGFPKLPFPWLFRRESYHLSPANGEEEFIRKLEERAVAFKQPTVETAAEISGKRGSASFGEEFLRDLEAAGLFSEEYSQEKQLWLEVWKCPTLLAYHNSVIEFFKHFRQELFLSPEPMLGASISIRQPLQTPYSTTTRQVFQSQFAQLS